MFFFSVAASCHDLC